MGNKYGTDLFYALENIIWYNGHYEWLKELRDELAKFSESNIAKHRNFTCPIDTKDWYTDKHAVWMVLVGMFGDWGTSIRSGWIEKIPECIDFINDICKMSWEEDDGKT